MNKWAQYQTPTDRSISIDVSYLCSLFPQWLRTQWFLVWVNYLFPSILKDPVCGFSPHGGGKRLLRNQHNEICHIQVRPRLSTAFAERVFFFFALLQQPPSSSWKLATLEQSCWKVLHCWALLYSMLITLQVFFVVEYQRLAETTPGFTLCLPIWDVCYCWAMCTSVKTEQAVSHLETASRLEKWTLHLKCTALYLMFIYLFIRFPLFTPFSLRSWLHWQKDSSVEVAVDLQACWLPGKRIWSCT